MYHRPVRMFRHRRRRRSSFTNSTHGQTNINNALRFFDGHPVTPMDLLLCFFSLTACPAGTATTTNATTTNSTSTITDDDDEQSCLRKWNGPMGSAGQQRIPALPSKETMTGHVFSLQSCHLVFLQGQCSLQHSYLTPVNIPMYCNRYGPLQMRTKQLAFFFLANLIPFSV